MAGVVAAQVLKNFTDNGFQIFAIHGILGNSSSRNNNQQQQGQRCQALASTQQ
jgi:hypothetical protein